MNLYKIGSLIKIAFGLAILLIDYNMINIFEDPVIGIGLGLVGSFLLSWGISFFVFFYAQERFRNIKYRDKNLVDAYKLSFLFGLFSLINVLLTLLGHWTKGIGLAFLIGFVVLQYFLLLEPKNEK